MKLNVREIAVFSMLGAMMFASKVLMEHKITYEDTLHTILEEIAALGDLKGLPAIGYSPKAKEVLDALEKADILGGLMVDGGLLWCATEKVSKAQLDRAVAIVKEVLGV